MVAPGNPDEKSENLGKNCKKSGFESMAPPIDIKDTK